MTLRLSRMLFVIVYGGDDNYCNKVKQAERGLVLAGSHKLVLPKSMYEFRRYLRF